MIPDLTIDGPEQSLELQFLPLSGHIEVALSQSPNNAETRALWLAGELVKSLRRGGEDTSLNELSLTEFDTLLAHIQSSLFGQNLRCETRCSDCKTGFEFSLDLGNFQAAVTAQADNSRIEDGIITDAETNLRFRAPKVSDLETLRRKGAATWLTDLLVDGAPEPAELESAINRSVPILSQDISAECPECKVKCSVRFDIANHLITQIAAEAAFVWREVHLLARSYGWQLSEILELSRENRRRLASFVIADAGVRRRAS